MSEAPRIDKLIGKKLLAKMIDCHPETIFRCEQPHEPSCAADGQACAGGGAGAVADGAASGEEAQTGNLAQVPSPRIGRTWTLASALTDSCVPSGAWDANYQAIANTEVRL